VPGGELVQRKPLLYQMLGENRRPIEGRYELRADGEVGFAVESYDAGKPLVIDPALSYSTYLGGTGSDEAWAVAVDGSGNAYVTGDTTSTNFPTVGNPLLQSALTGSTDVFVAKLNPAGTALLYSTYLGGTQSQFGRAIAVDTDGAAYVAGYTSSTDFPYTLDAFQSGETGGNIEPVGFVAKLNASGSALIYATSIGSASGNNPTYVYGIAVNAANAYVTGTTSDWGIPMSATAFQQHLNGYQNAFVIKLNSTGTGEAYGTYLGGTGFDGGNGIAVDSSGNAYVTGFTGSTDFPTVNPIQASNHGIVSNIYNSAFVSKLNADGSALLYSTYLGGENITRANAIAVDGNGNAYVTGVTYEPTSGASDTFPLQNPLQPALGGGTDAFLTKINAGGTAWVYSTYLGGSGNDSGLSVAVDAAGNAYVTGQTVSDDFPVVDAFQPNRGGADLPVLKSLDGGTTWNAGIASGPTGAVNTLVVNPVNTTTLYAGTATGRVYQSIDGGAHWSRSDSGLPGAPVSSLAIAATNTATLFAGTTAGVFESTSGGATWFAQNSGLTNTTVNAVAVDPTNANIVYAATGSGTSGSLFMSTNGGGTWTAVVTGTGSYFTCLAIDPVEPQWVYSGTASGYIVYTFNAFATAAQTYKDSSVTSVNALAVNPAAGLLYGAVSAYCWSPNPYADTNCNFVPWIRTTGLQCVNGLCETSQYDGNGPGLSVAIDAAGKVYVGRTSVLYGVANTGDFVGPFQAIAADTSNAGTLYIGNSGAASDGFLAVVNPTGTALLSSSYFGGILPDAAQAVVVDTNGNAWLAGATSSTDFPVTAGAMQPANAGGQDAFVARFFPPGPMLSVTSSHTGDFMQGQIGATYTVTVSNAPGGSPTNGTVTVSETVPGGMTLMSMAGTDWTCPAHQTTCWRSDALNGGEPYPAIAVTVNVSESATSQVTNQAGVSWGVSASATASDLTNISPLACNVSGDGSPSVADVQLLVNQALGAIAAVDDMNGDGAVNVVDVQIVINAALTLGCKVSAVK